MSLGHFINLVICEAIVPTVVCPRPRTFYVERRRNSYQNLKDELKKMTRSFSLCRFLLFQPKPLQQKQQHHQQQMPMDTWSGLSLASRLTQARVLKLLPVHL